MLARESIIATAIIMGKDSFIIAVVYASITEHLCFRSFLAVAVGVSVIVYIQNDDGVINPNGVVFRVYLWNGHVLYVVAGDMKADRDTNPDSHQHTYNLTYGIDNSNADVIEFIIDKDNMDRSFWSNNFDGQPTWLQGEIIRIEKLDKTVL